MLSQYAKQELRSLQDQTSHSLDIDDFDDITRLEELCHAITDNSEPDNDILDMPVTLGGYQLKQPSIGVLEWYNEYYLPLFDTDPLMADGGLAFALSLADTPAELWELNDKKAVKKAVKRFLRRLSCTHQELQDVLIQLLGVKENEGESKGEGSAGRLVAMLCKEYGHTAHYWMWEAPIGYINTFVHDYVARVEAETESVRNASTGASKPPPAESRVKKFKALRDHTNMMRDKWQKM